MRKICVVTGTRAEYGILSGLMKEIRADAEMQLQVIVTGMHLSPEFGLTYREIEQEFSIDRKIEILLSSDSAVGISKSMGLAQISFGEAYAELRPDIVVLLGDRFEIFSAAASATIARIPIAHIHGGETTEGAFDEAMRHSITKMSHLHFAAAEAYRQRIIQLGEEPARVFNFGAPGLDNIHGVKLLDRAELEHALGCALGKRNLLVTFHPATLEMDAAAQFRELLTALDGLEDTRLLFTKANADTEGRAINALVDEYVAAHPGKAVGFASLGQLRYLSALRHVDAVVGNSSSGLIEAPSFRIGTINIGDRQKGRIRASSVIDCAPQKDAIAGALRRLYTPEFQQGLREVVNPYGAGGATKKIAGVLRLAPLAGLLKKRFHDLPGINQP
jgi:GDP/UDP-N,N'-diacetylbacillosamine 2-epimerase (hydrolysing)